MTSDAISKMNFKVGKYLIDGDNYRSTIENLLNEHIDDHEMVELTFQFFASTITTQGALTKIEALARIAESCSEIDKFPDHLKEAIKDTYTTQIEPYMREMIEETMNLDEMNNIFVMKNKDSDIL